MAGNSNGGRESKWIGELLPVRSEAGKLESDLSILDQDDNG